MLYKQALVVLGIKENLDERDVKKRYRYLMHKVHPDTFAVNKASYKYSAQEINEAYYSKMQEIMDKKLESPTYGDAQTVTIQVAPDGDGVYSISESDLSQIDAAMFPADGF